MIYADPITERQLVLQGTIVNTSLIMTVKRWPERTNKKSVCQIILEIKKIKSIIISCANHEKMTITYQSLNQPLKELFQLTRPGSPVQ